jgi:hypothetical protein
VAAPFDDFQQLRIDRREGIRNCFVPQLYFGCEADDPMTATAFDPQRNPFGSRIHAISGLLGVGPAQGLEIICFGSVCGLIFELRLSIWDRETGPYV